MKQIIFGFLRRWRLGYLIAILVVTGVDLAAALAPGFREIWTPYIAAPWLGGFLVTMDLISGTSRLTVTLPVSVRRSGTSYWLLGVCVPTFLLTLIQLLATVVASIAGAPDWASIPTTFLTAFLLAGVSFFASALLPGVQPKPDRWANALVSQIKAGGVALFWMVSMTSGLMLPQLFKAFHFEPIMVAGQVTFGLVLTWLGYRHATEMILRRARPRVSGEKNSTPSLHFKATGGFGRSGLFSLFGDTFPTAIGMAAIGLLFQGVFSPLRGNMVFLYFLCFFISMIASLRYLLSLRMLRTLPVSSNRLAAALFLLPIGNAAVFIGVMVLGRLAGLESGLVLNAVSGSTLLLVVSLACACVVLCVRFGPKMLAGLFFVSLWGLMVFVYAVTRLHLPQDAFYWVAIGLMVFSFVFLRKWIGVSESYRPKVEELAPV